MFDGGPLRVSKSPYLGPAISTEIASEAWQVRAYHDLRRAVFVGEQALFDGTDADELDANALPIVAMTVCHGMPDQVVGTVRIFRKPTDPPNVWYGGRLAVDPAYRRHGSIGDGLIRAAVCSAHALGCREFLATVQLPVVRYFERHHFAVRGSVDVCGIEHALMQADLEFYPPRYYGKRDAGDGPGWHETAPRLRSPEAA